MLQISPQMTILVSVKPVDFRKGIDGLSQLCRRELERDPLSGAVFVFRNKSGTSLKALVYDGQGYWLCQKRLSEGKFKWWPKYEAGTRVYELLAREAQALLWNGDPGGMKAAPDWQRIRGVDSKQKG